MSYIPVALAVTRLLDSVGVVIGTEPGLGKVAREMLFGRSSAVGETNVVTVVDFVRTGHYESHLSASKCGRVQVREASEGD